MIRFKCPHCGRQYELPAVLARMALLCKGCGQSISAPKDAVDEPEPQLEVKVPPPPVRPPAPPPVAPPKKPAPPPDKASDRALPTAEPDEAPEPTRAARAEPPKTVWPTPEQRELSPIPAAPPPARGNLIPVVVDVAVGLILLAVSVLLGEMLCQKSTSRVWFDAGGAVEFPPTELLMWAAPPVLAMLLYGLLVSRGTSVGNWLKRRAA